MSKRSTEFQYREEGEIRDKLDAVDDVIKPLWSMGWNIKWTLLGVICSSFIVGFILNSTWLLGTLGFLASPFVAAAGVLHVDQNYKSVREQFFEIVEERSHSILKIDEEANPSTYSLYSSAGSKILRRPAIRYFYSTMVVSDYSVTIHDGNELNMMSLKYTVSDSTEEIYLDQISSLDYSDGKLRIKTSSEQSSRMWECDRKPDEALDDLQQRVREYKRTAVSN